MKNNLKFIISKIEKAEKKKTCRSKEKLKIRYLKKYLNDINESIGSYNAILFFIEPRGKNYASYDEEFSLFLRKIKDNQNYSPTFTYPKISKIKLKKLNSIISKLNKLRKSAKQECKDKNIAEIIFEVLDITKAKIGFLKELKKKNFKKSFEYSKIVYGDIEDDLYKKAQKAYKRKIEYLINVPPKSKLERKLENIEFNAKKIKSYFELALKMAGLEDGNYRVIIDNDVGSIKVSERNSKYNCPVILIPSRRRINGKELLQLIAHEIGRHAATNIYNKKQGFNGEIGRDWEMFNEGIAKKSENEIRKAMFSNIYSDFAISFSVYYILAIKKIKMGYNFNKVYKYIFDLIYREKILECGYYNLKKQHNKSGYKSRYTKNKITSLKNKSKKEAIELSKKICLRVFRGFNPKKGFMYFPKDKIYFEGEIKVSEMSKLKSGNKLEKYLRLSKVDPKFIPFLIKNGAYKYKKNLSQAKNVAVEMWKNEKIRKCILERKIISKKMIFY